MKTIRFLIFFVLAFLIAQPMLLAIDDEDSRYQDTPQAGTFKISDILKEPVENLELELFAGSSLGYDDNIYLYHHDKVGSFFNESIFSAEAKYPMPIWNWIKLKMGYDFTHIMNFRNSDADLFNNIVSGGIETILYDLFTVDANYRLDFVRYPKDNQSNYLANEIEVGAKHDITDWISHRVSWEVMSKDFDRRKAWNHLYTIKLGDREDTRHTFEHEAVVTLFNRSLLKLSNKIYYNDSNFDFLDYYDYHAYKTSGSLIHLLTNKLSGRLNLSYQRKVYDQRTVSDKDKTQHDHLFTYGGSLLYDIIPSVSLVLNYTYRRNYSNENDQQYSGSIVTTGIYYSF